MGFAQQRISTRNPGSEPVKLSYSGAWCGRHKQKNGCKPFEWGKVFRCLRKSKIRRSTFLDLAEILDQHKIWVESGGESGVKADLCGVNLSRSDLTGVNLEGAFLQRANLIGSDLSMANLRGASLVQADLRESNLLGTELRGANLMGANLYGAEGVWVGRLGGTNLFDAIVGSPGTELEFAL